MQIKPFRKINMINAILSVPCGFEPALPPREADDLVPLSMSDQIGIDSDLLLGS